MFNKYARKDSIQSCYCYPDTEIYINFFDIRNKEELDALESDLTSNRLSELLSGNYAGRFGSTHLKNIHKHIFQDVYPFAGQIRTEDIWKGDTFFCKSEFIQSNLECLLLKLKTEKYLKECTESEFVSQLSYYMSELNIIHPFREGNGRAIREFIRQLAQKNSYELSWFKLDADELLKATILAVDHNYEVLESCIRFSLSR